MSTQRLPNGRGLARWWKVLSAIQVVDTVAILTACEIPTEGSRVEESVAVNAERQSLEVGDSTVWEAVARDQEGGVLLDRHPTWSVSDTTVAALAKQGAEPTAESRGSRPRYPVMASRNHRGHHRRSSISCYSRRRMLQRCLSVLAVVA